MFNNTTGFDSSNMSNSDAGDISWVGGVGVVLLVCYCWYLYTCAKAAVCKDSFTNLEGQPLIGEKSPGFFARWGMACKEVVEACPSKQDEHHHHSQP